MGAPRRLDVDLVLRDDRSRAVDFRRDTSHGCSLRSLDFAAAAVTRVDGSTIAA